jgi:hypothetical protein
MSNKIFKYQIIDTHGNPIGKLYSKLGTAKNYISSSCHYGADCKGFKIIQYELVLTGEEVVIDTVAISINAPHSFNRYKAIYSDTQEKTTKKEKVDTNITKSEDNCFIKFETR